MIPVQNIIQTEGLTKYYRATRGISDVNLQVQRGEVFGLLGPAGAGKTTLIRTLLNFVRPTSGRASIFGLDSCQDTTRIRAAVGYIPSEPHFYKQMRTGELLDYLTRLDGDPCTRCYTRMADCLQLDLARPIRKLNWSERYKLSLVQAFMHHPRLVVLDEPAQSFDSELQHSVQRLIEDARHDGVTFLLGTRDLAVAELICDRVGIMCAGTLRHVLQASELSQQTVRQVQIYFAEAIPAAAFRTIENLQSFNFERQTLRCTILGSMTPLLRQSVHFPVVEIQSQYPPLEEALPAFFGGSDVEYRL